VDLIERAVMPGFVSPVICHPVAGLFVRLNEALSVHRHGQCISCTRAQPTHHNRRQRGPAKQQSIGFHTCSSPMEFDHLSMSGLMHVPEQSADSGLHLYQFILRCDPLSKFLQVSASLPLAREAVYDSPLRYAFGQKHLEEAKSMTNNNRRAALKA